MRFRQIHLDFHTSGLIPGVGSRFDPEEFASAFKSAHVDSVTLFSKCHHGYSYHPTEVGEMHPHLGFNLLRAQIDALHGVGINTPIYLTATWDELAAFKHPEWRTVTMDDGSPRFLSTSDGAGWAFLDYSTPYLDYLCAQTEEVMQMFPDGDGIFMDISIQLPSVSSYAKTKMDKLGLDWTNPDDRVKFTEMAVEEYFDRVTAAVRKYDPKRPIFFNSGHIRRGNREHYLKYYTHLELESLPTAGWGYEHFPLSARYVEQLGLPFLGMTGKFHYHWGEVGGYKKPEALLYECGAMIAYGARCSVGDHLHPTGMIDRSTMAVIAPAYEWIEQREPWCVDTKSRAEIALLSAEAVSKQSLVGMAAYGASGHEAADGGAVRILLEGQFAFDVVDLQSELKPYRLVILPDVIEVDDTLKQKLDAYVAAGGRVLLTGKSGVHPERGLLFDVGARWAGTSGMTGGDYLLPNPELRAHQVNDPLFMYLPSEQIEVTDGQSLGQIYDPYMDRTPKHFSGHVNAPSRPEPTPYAAGVQRGGFTYLAHPIFSCYHKAGAVAMLEIAEKAIQHALGRSKMIETSLPRAGRVTLREQAGEKRDVLHLLYATPILRGNLRGSNIQPIQDIITLSDIEVAAEARSEVRSVRLVPEGQTLPFEAGEGRVSFTVPRLHAHQMVEIAYA